MQHSELDHLESHLSAARAPPALLSFTTFYCIADFIQICNSSSFGFHLVTPSYTFGFPRTIYPLHGDLGMNGTSAPCEYMLIQSHASDSLFSICIHLYLCSASKLSHNPLVKSGDKHSFNFDAIWGYLRLQVDLRGAGLALATPVYTPHQNNANKIWIIKKNLRRWVR